MTYKMSHIFVLASLISVSLGQPVENKVEMTFVGEVSSCIGVSAQVDIYDVPIQVEETAIVEVVAASAATALISSNDAISEAGSIGFKILEILIQSFPTINATINSPSQGCWAVAFARVEAATIAKTVVDAVIEGMSVTEIGTLGIPRIQDIQTAIEQFVLLLGKGDGSGKSSEQADIAGDARATTINCVFAEAYAGVFKDDAQAILKAGCPRFFFASPLCFTDAEACAYVNDIFSGVPKGCGSWGGADSICYVRNPARCSCAQSSDTLPGEKWRFCDSTLEAMKSLLDFEDFENQIYGAEAKFGYCPSLAA